MRSQDLTPPCPAHQPVSHWRTCDSCARARQAKIADIAQDIERRYPALTWITLTPSTSSRRTIDAIRDAYLRQADTEAGLWTIERGTQSGRLHCNIITTHHLAPRTRGAEIHAAAIRGNVRDIAAYISKRSQIPDLSHYAGRVFGKFGMLRDFLPTNGMPEVVQAAYIEQHVMPNDAWHRHMPERERTAWHANHPPEDYKANMRKHLPRIFEIIDAGMPKINQGAKTGLEKT